MRRSQTQILIIATNTKWLIVLLKTFLYILYILSSTVGTLLICRETTTVGKHNNEPKLFFDIHRAANAPETIVHNCRRCELLTPKILISERPQKILPVHDVRKVVARDH